MKLRFKKLKKWFLEVYINEQYETTINDDEIMWAGTGQIPIDSHKWVLLKLFWDLQKFITQQSEKYEAENEFY